MIDFAQVANASKHCAAVETDAVLLVPRARGLNPGGFSASIPCVRYKKGTLLGAFLVSGGGDGSIGLL